MLPAAGFRYADFGLATMAKRWQKATSMRKKDQGPIRFCVSHWLVNIHFQAFRSRSARKYANVSAINDVGCPLNGKDGIVIAVLSLGKEGAENGDKE